MSNTTRTLPPWAYQPDQPVTYPSMFLAVAAQRGVPAATILAHAGRSREPLDDPAARTSLAAVFDILHAVHELTGDGTIGFETGRRLPLTAHGNLGYALMCAATPRDAIQLLERFWHLRGRGALLSFHESERRLFFELTPEIPGAPAVRDLLFSSMLTSMCRGVDFVLPLLPTRAEIWLPGAEPAGFDEHRSELPLVRFEMPCAGVVLNGPTDWLDQPLPTAHPEGLTQALAQCERESALMEPGNDILRKARAAMTAGPDGYPDPESLAERLHMTSRTLRRRLREQGYRYRQLLEEAQKRDGCQLLADSELEIQHISQLLGFQDPANFTRAFRQWTGQPPSQWRRRHRNDKSS